MSATPMNEIDAKLAKLSHNLYSVNLFKVVCECGPLGTYVVEAKKPDEEYAATVIPGFRVLDDEGDQKFKARDIPGAEIALDIVQRNPGLGLLTYAEGDARKPTPEDIETARQSLYEADKQRLMWGDHIWEKSHDRALISGEWTRACKRLDAKREWAADFQVDAQIECPFCSEYIKATAKVCKHCHRDLVEVPAPAAKAAVKR